MSCTRENPYFGVKGENGRQVYPFPVVQCLQNEDHVKVQ